MMTIRHAQLLELASTRSEGLVATVIGAMHRSLPERTAALGEVQLHALVLRGLEAAGGHGLQRTRDLVRFVGAMLLLGEGFDDDPRWPWARSALGSTTEPGEKLDRLYAQLRAQLRAQDHRGAGHV